MKQYDNTWAVLEEALASIDYRREPPPGPRFRLIRNDASNYAQLQIFTYNVDAYSPEDMRHTRHEFIVPQATYNKETWVRWVFDRILSIELHETTEFFFVKNEATGKTRRIYAPHHGNGWDPYSFWPGHDVREKSKQPGDD